MNNSENDVLFTAVDPKGYPVVLTSTRYYEHILSSDSNHQAHAEFTPDEVKETIEDPIFIYEGNQPNSDVYVSKNCSQYPSMYLRVVVAKFPDCGDVMTAYINPKPFSGNKEGGIKYAKLKFELR